MNKYLQRMFWASWAGICLLGAVESMQTGINALTKAMQLGDSPPLPIGRKRGAVIGVIDTRDQVPDTVDQYAHWVETQNNYVANLDRAAGAAHGHVGDNLGSCALCLCPARHPIHLVDEDQALIDVAALVDLPGDEAEVFDLTGDDAERTD